MISVRTKLKHLIVASVFILVAGSSVAQTGVRKEHWITSWASAQQAPEPQNALPVADITNATLRQIVHLSAGGTRLRLGLSNAFGTQPLRIENVHLALPSTAASSAIVAESDRQVLFSGQKVAFIPAGAELISDPILFPAKALSSIAVSMFFVDPPATQTSHPGSRATSYYAHGDLTGAAEFPADAKKIDHWFQLAAVDIDTTDPAAFTVVALGDSITDGHGATTNGNDRWPDVLATRLNGATRTDIGIANAGIGGNRLLLDGLGPNALARFDRDVLGPSDTRWVLVLEGVNDLGTASRDHEISQAEHDALVARILGGYAQIVSRAHAHGIKVAGATITPYMGSEYYHPGPAGEADRQKLNAWVRAAGHFDAVFDFDAVVRDPAAPDCLLAAYDSGDHLHPSPKGYAAMANSIDLNIFVSESIRRHR